MGGTNGYKYLPTPHNYRQKLGYSSSAISDDLLKVEKRHRMSNGSYRRFANAQEREEFFETFVYNYNHTRLKCLGYKSPLEMLKNVSNHEANNTQGESGKIVVNQASFFDFVVFLS